MKNPYNQEFATQSDLQDAMNSVPAVAGAILQSEKGAENGVAPLDDSSPIPQVPEEYVYNVNTRLNSLEDYQGHDKGIYTTSAALIAAHPSATAGDFAYVQETSSRWIWETSQWIDTEQDIKDNFLNKNNFLSEFDDETKKLNARNNLSVYSKAEVDVVEAKIKPQNGFIDRTSSVLSMSSNIVTIAPTASSYIVFVKGKKYVITTSYSVSIPNTIGLHYIYFDEGVAGLELKSTLSRTKDLFNSFAYVANLYWNGSSATLGIQDERHGTNMDGDVHFYNHTTFGTVFRSGLEVSLTADGDGSLDSHARFSSASGIIADEDNIFDIASKSLTSQFPLIYRSGTTWVEEITNFIVKTTGSGRAAYNQNVSGSYQLTEIANNDYGICYVVAGTSNDASKRIFVLMGSQSFATIQAARLAVEQRPDLSGLPFEEFKLVAGIIFQTSTSYTNAVKTRIRTIDGTTAYVDWRITQILAQGANPSASDLANLQDQITSLDGTLDQALLDLADKANDVAVVHLTGDETINGTKTFASYPKKQGDYSAPTDDLEFVSKKYVDDKVASEDNWNRSGTDLTPTNSGDNINLGTGGLKDANVSTAVNIGDSTNTSFSTTNKTIIGSVNELKASNDLKVIQPDSYSVGNLIKYNPTTKKIEDAGTTVQDLVDLEESYINLPAYQDFTNVVGTTLTLTTNSNCFLENGTPAPQSITNNALVVSNSATATLASDPNQYPRTSAFSSIKLISSIITASNTNQTITLSAIPRTADKDNIRIYFVIRCKRKDVPIIYNEFPKNVRVNLQALDVEGMATDDELQSAVSDTSITGKLLTNLTSAASYSVLATTDTILQAFGKIKKLLDTTNSFDRWVDAVVGSDSFTTNSKLIPFATINKALTSAQFPLKIHLLGQSFTENLTLTSGQSNITIGSEFTASGGVQTELNGTIATSSSFTRLRLMNLTLNAGSSIPITLASGDLGRHVFENVIIQTTNSSLMSIPTNFQNWIDLIGVDISGSAASILALPTLVGTTATLNIKKLKGILNISAAANSGWTIYIDSDCVLNWIGGYNNTPVFYTGQPKIDASSIITANSGLASIVKSSSALATGLHIVNYAPTSTTWTASTAYVVDQFVSYLGVLYLCTTAHTSGASFDPTKFTNTNLTGIARGDIFYHSAAYINAILYPFAIAPSAVNLLTIGTYSKTSNGWQLMGSGGVWGSITGTLSSQSDLQAALNAKQNSLGITPSTSNAFQVVRIKPDGTGYETALDVPTYTTTQRDALTNVPTNYIIYNSTDTNFQKYNGSTWDNIGGSAFTNSYAGNFLASSFVNGVLTIPASTHGLGVTGDLVVTLLDSTYIDVTWTAKITIDSTTGNVTVSVNIGEEFDGRALITKIANTPYTNTLPDNSVTNAKLAQMAANTFKGNNTASTTNSIDLTATQATAMLNNVVGDSGSGGTKGLVPAPAAGDAAAGKALFASGAWGVVYGAAFSAGNTLSTRQSVPSGVSTKITFNSEKFDTNNNFTNSRFTPTVAGYYRISAAVRFEGSSGTGECYAKITKNGAEEKRGSNFSGVLLATNYFQVQVDGLVYVNGSTDYIEIEAIQTSGGNRDVTNVDYITYFDGNFERGA